MGISTTEWLADRLVRSIRRRAFMPRADETYTDEELLEVADEETRDYLVPTLRAVDEEFLVRKYDFTITAGTAEYRLPPRATAEALRAVLWAPNSDSVYSPVDRIDPTHGSLAQTRQVTAGFYVEDDRIIFSPTPTETVPGRLLIFQRPGRLVLVADAAKIATLPSTAECTVVAAPSWLVTGAGLDVVAGQPGWRTLQTDNTGTVSSLTVTFGTAVPATIVVGDYLCEPGTSCFPQLPDICHPLLAQRVAVKLLEGKDSAGYDKALGELVAAEARVKSVLKPRTVAHPTYVHNFNAPGWRRR